MTVVISLILVAAFAASVIENRSTRKALIDMSISIDNLNNELARLEATAAAAIAKLQTAPSDDPAIDAATARVKAVADNIDAAIAPKA